MRDFCFKQQWAPPVAASLQQAALSVFIVLLYLVYFHFLVPLLFLFRIVGVVLGTNDRLATSAHAEPRLAKALITTRRLRQLSLPAALTALLWRTAVLPQALYGCELRNITPDHLTPLSRAGQAAVSAQSPLHLNTWRAPEVLMGPPLGQCAVLDPVLALRQRQLQWLQLIANSPDLVGFVHRHVAWDGLQWREPSKSLAAALQAMGWSVRRNLSCARTPSWPLVLPELSYPGPITLSFVDSFAPVNAAYTDGSVMQFGGATVVQPDTDTLTSVRVGQPRSSTHCELIALGLGLQLATPASALLTDSLISLQLLRHWGSRSARRVLACADQVEIRWLLALASSGSPVPGLEKVAGHDTRAWIWGTRRQWEMIRLIMQLVQPLCPKTSPCSPLIYPHLGIRWSCWTPWAAPSGISSPPSHRCGGTVASGRDLCGALGWIPSIPLMSPSTGLSPPTASIVPLSLAANSPTLPRCLC